jgi:steroid delta-isomerase-like uncharacterized protein
MSEADRINFETIVRNYYLAISREDKTHVLSLVSADLCHVFNFAPEERGIAQFEKFLDIKFEHYKESFEHLRIYSDPNGSRGAVEFQLNGFYQRSYPGLPAAKGQRYSIPVGAFIELEGGFISKIVTLFNFEDWLKQILAQQG